MVLALAFAVILHQQPVDRNQVREALLRRLAEAGLKLEKSDDKLGSITIDKYTHVDANSDGKPLRFVTLSRTFVAKTYIPQADLKGWTKRQDARARWVTNLDHTVMARQSLDLSQLSSKQALKSDVEAFGREVKGFENSFTRADARPVLRLPETKDEPPVDESIVIEDVTRSDLEYLVRQWHLNDGRGPAGSSGGWFVTCQLSGNTVWLMQPFFLPDGKQSGFHMESEIETVKLPSVYLEKLNRVLERVQVKDTFEGHVRVWQDFTVSTPTPISLIRKTLNQFGRDVDSVKKRIAESD